MEYMYINVHDTFSVKSYRGLNGLEYARRDGKRFLVHRKHTVLVDPRGHFVGLRLGAIRVLDKIMGLLKKRKPLLEFCEFLANYPLW